MPLTSLRIRDIATIADVTLELRAGLNVLTGETGAGKSMLVDALALLLGDRADRAAVRPGASRAVIEGVLEEVPAATHRILHDAGIDIEEQLIVRREVTAEGRSRAWVNSSPVTIGLLATLGESLVDLHGQHQTLRLLESGVQRDLIDGYSDTVAPLKAVAAAYQELVVLRDGYAALAERRDSARRRADWLQHLVSEIQSAKIKPGETEALATEGNRLAQAGALSEHARRIAEAIDADRDGARQALSRADRALHALEKLDPNVASWRELQDGAYAQLDELARLAENYASELSEDPGRLQEIEQRRDQLSRLTLKHGVDLPGLLSLAAEAAAELELLDTADVDLRAMQARIVVAEDGIKTLAAVVSELRRAGGERLSRAMARLLPTLGLTGGELIVALEPIAEPGVHGTETVQFLVRLNRGMEFRPLAKVASGGELSRLMLALKVVLAQQDAVPTLVFDEVDQGIGGEVGAKVGEALARVAERHQVLVITHLPQIAAKADHHLRVEKSQRSGIATSDVVTLRGEDRVDELARMLGDSDGAAARRLAVEMLAETRRR